MIVIRTETFCCSDKVTLSAKEKAILPNLSSTTKK